MKGEVEQGEAGSISECYETLTMENRFELGNQKCEHNIQEFVSSYIDEVNSISVHAKVAPSVFYFPDQKQETSRSG